MIEEFVVKNPLFSFSGTRVLDTKRIVALSDEDFATLHLELMTEYRNKDGWWSDGNVPHCSECNNSIDSPENLRRYYGRSLHPGCFTIVYEREGKKEKGVQKMYWDRVAKLVLTSE